MPTGTATLLRDTDEPSLSDVLVGEVARQVIEAKADPLSRELIIELADANSPIWADELPKSKFSKSLQLYKLYQLTERNVAYSEMAKHGDSLVRKFHISDFGKKVASRIRAES